MNASGARSSDGLCRMSHFGPSADANRPPERVGGGPLGVGSEPVSDGDGLKGEPTRPSPPTTISTQRSRASTIRETARHLVASRNGLPKSEGPGEAVLGMLSLGQEAPRPDGCKTGSVLMRSCQFGRYSRRCRTRKGGSYRSESGRADSSATSRGQARSGRSHRPGRSRPTCSHRSASRPLPRTSLGQ
jgi:hypothetical protein